MARLRGTVLWLIGLSIGGAFLWLALRSIDLNIVCSILYEASAPDALGVVGCAIAFIYVKALRWGALIRHLRPVSFKSLLGAVFAGAAVNFAVPHGGEFVRAWMVSMRDGLPKASLLASIGVERLLDFCTVLLLGFVAVFVARGALAELGGYLWTLMAFIVAMLAVVLPFVLWPRGALEASRRLFAPLPRSARDWIARHLEHGIEGIGALQRGRTLVSMFGLSIAQWLLMGGCAWFSVRAVGIVPDPVLAVVVLLLLVVGLTLPAAPGHVGTTQIAFLLAARPFGVGREEAIAASFVYNVFLPVPLILIGTAVMLIAFRRHPVPVPRR